MGDHDVDPGQRDGERGVELGDRRREAGRDASGVEVALQALDRRMARVEERDPDVADPGVRGGTTPGDDAHVVPGVGQHDRLAAEHPLHAPHDGVGGVVDQGDRGWTNRPGAGAAAHARPTDPVPRARSSIAAHPWAATRP